MGIGQKLWAVFRALLVSYIVTALLLVLIAFLMYRMGFGDRTLDLLLIVVHVLATFLGGWISGKLVQEKRYLWGLAFGGAYLLVLGIVSFVLNGTIQFSAGSSLTSMIFCLAAAMLGGMLAQ